MILYCSTVSNYYSKKGAAATAINSYEIRLKRNTDSDSLKTHISGIETFDFDSERFGTGRTFLGALFEDIMSVLGVPTSTISAIVGSLMRKPYPIRLK